MQKNWYAVYTKPHCERKVSLLLSKKKIENFCPLNYKVTRSLFRKTISFEPVFNAYVFVKCMDTEITTLSKQVNGILSILYWKGKPATINEEEINAIREFTSKQHDIRLEKLNTKIEKLENQNISYLLDGQIVMVKNTPLKVDLPSLGFTMVANVKETGILGSQLANQQLGVLAN
ncbi:MAG TPA: transcription termination/antitermination NusG family protein [Hanamia sp.]|jgi:transcription antitermination factor NusG|nr:transcription termination/antitermination NusG family protein [Hanamia sp.]